jgi:hypothetical protein
MYVITMRQTRNSGAAMIALGWFAFCYEYPNPDPGDSLMKPVAIGTSIGLDRLATWNEIRCAISVSTEDVPSLGGTCNDLREVDSVLSRSARNVSEDDMWFAMAGEMPDFEIN